MGPRHPEEKKRKPGGGDAKNPGPFKGRRHRTQPTPEPGLRGNVGNPLRGPQSNKNFKEARFF